MTIISQISSPPTIPTFIKATTIVGYAADAAICCPTCHKARYGNAETDREGNPITPVIVMECSDADTCDQCNRSLVG